MIILCQFTRMVEAIKKSLEYFGYGNIRKRKSGQKLFGRKRCFVLFTNWKWQKFNI